MIGSEKCPLCCGEISHGSSLQPSRGPLQEGDEGGSAAGRGFCQHRDKERAAAAGDILPSTHGLKEPFAPSHPRMLGLSGGFAHLPAVVAELRAVSLSFSGFVTAAAKRGKTQQVVMMGQPAASSFNSPSMPRRHHPSSCYGMLNFLVLLRSVKFPVLLWMFAHRPLCACAQAAFCPRPPGPCPPAPLLPHQGSARCVCPTWNL